MERVSAEDIRAALAVLRPLFEEAAVVEPKAETAAGDLLRLRSETFLLERRRGTERWPWNWRERPAAWGGSGNCCIWMN